MLIQLMVGDSEHNKQTAILVESSVSQDQLFLFHRIACEMFGIKWGLLCDDIDQSPTRVSIFDSIKNQESWDKLYCEFDTDENEEFIYFRENTFAELYMYLAWLGSDKTIIYKIINTIPKINIGGYALTYN